MAPPTESADLLLCLLAIAAFLPVASPRKSHIVAFVAGLVGAGGLAFAGIALGSGTLASVAIGVASLYLWSPHSQVAAAAGIGFLTIGTGVSLASLGLPLMFSILSGSLYLAAAWSTVRQRVQQPTAALVTEAVVLVAVFALIVGAVPLLVDGWRAAVALNATVQGTTAVSPASDALVLASICAAAMVAGVAYTQWRRRS